MNRFITPLTLALLLLIAGCSRSEDQPLVLGNYTIQTVNEQRYEVTPADITLMADRIIGRGPVNRWSAPIVNEDTIGPIITTKMVGPPERMKIEQQLLSALEGSTIRCKKKQLTLTKEHKVVLTASVANAQK